MSDASIQDSPIRLKISHLLLWTGMAALLLSLNRLSYGTYDDLSLLSPNYVVFIIEIMIYAAVLTGMLVLVRSRRPWQRIRHPGHWMLLIRGFLLIFILFTRFFWPISGVINVSWLVSLMALDATLFGAAAIVNRSLWRGYFIFVGIVQDAPFVIQARGIVLRPLHHSVIMYAHDVGLPVITLMMLAYAVYDARKQKRDSLHCVGIACDVLLVVNSAWYMAYFRMKN